MTRWSELGTIRRAWQPWAHKDGGIKDSRANEFIWWCRDYLYQNGGVDLEIDENWLTKLDQYDEYSDDDEEELFEDLVLYMYV